MKSNKCESHKTRVFVLIDISLQNFRSSRNQCGSVPLLTVWMRLQLVHIVHSFLLPYRSTKSLLEQHRHLMSSLRSRLVRECWSTPVSLGSKVCFLFLLVASQLATPNPEPRHSPLGHPKPKTWNLEHVACRNVAFNTIHYTAIQYSVH